MLDEIDRHGGREMDQADLHRDFLRETVVSTRIMRGESTQLSECLKYQTTAEGMSDQDELAGSAIWGSSPGQPASEQRGGIPDVLNLPWIRERAQRSDPPIPGPVDVDDVLR
jgi:hypothetical protein